MRSSRDNLLAGFLWETAPHRRIKSKRTGTALIRQHGYLCETTNHNRHRVHSILNSAYFVHPSKIQRKIGRTICESTTVPRVVTMYIVKYIYYFSIIHFLLLFNLILLTTVVSNIKIGGSKESFDMFFHFLLQVMSNVHIKMNFVTFDSRPPCMSKTDSERRRTKKKKGLSNIIHKHFCR